MNTNLVVDCSYILSNFFLEEEKLDLSLYRVYVPAIFYLECSNVLLNSYRKNKITEKDLNSYIEILYNLPFFVDKFCSTPESIYSVINLSKKFDLSSYGASYLELAVRLNSDLKTFDKKLEKAFLKLRS